METQAPTRAKIAVMALFALSCFGLLLFLWVSFGGPIPLKPEGYRIHVRFEEATQLAEQADVRISGVPVGKVIRTEDKDGRTDALIELKRDYAPLPKDSRAILRLKTLLGETYVELTPGNPAGPKLAEGGTLPIANVKPTVELDEILRAFDTRTRTDLRRWMVGWSAALKGREQDLSDVVGNLGPGAEDLNGMTATLDSQRAAVRKLIRDSGTVFGAIGGREAAVRTLISAGDRVLATTAARNRELTTTIQALPPFLRELRPTLAAAEGAAADAAPVLRALRPAAPLVQPALRDASALAPDLRALFQRLDPVITVARTALPAATRVLRTAGPLVDRLAPLGSELVPAVQYLGLYKRELVTQFVNIAADNQGSFTPPGGKTPLHYIRALVPVTSEAFVQNAKRLPSNRHNAYLAPGGLADLGKGGVKAFDCANLKNFQAVPVIGSVPPCRVQGPLTFRGHTRQFTHVDLSGK